MGRQAGPRLAGRWRERLARFVAGRLGVGAFCRREGISPASFYQWRRKLGSAATGNGAAFQEVELIASAPQGSATIRLPGGAVFEVENDRALVEALFRDALASGSREVAAAEKCVAAGEAVRC